MKRFLKKASFLTEQALGALGLIGILVITANAFCRFALKVPMSWSDELLRTMMIYGYFTGAALMFCQGECMRLEILDTLLKKHPRAYWVLNLVLAVINTLFFGLMTWYLGSMISQYVASGTTTSTSSTPAWIVPLGCALGMSIISVAAFVQLATAFVKKSGSEGTS